MTGTARILICECASAHVVPRDVIDNAKALLAERNLAVHIVDDLCAAAARSDPLLKQLATEPQLMIMACHPRAVRWLFAAANAPLTMTETQLVDLRQQPTAELPLLLDAARDNGSPALATEQPPTHTVLGEWPPWFPVIDYDRCKNCRQCLNFCLFGVYAQRQDGWVEVQHPQHCKNNCPACARICPEAAIIFPKYGEQPFNGAEILDEETVRTKAQQASKAVLGNDVLAGLEQRKHRRQLLR